MYKGKYVLLPMFDFKKCVENYLGNSDFEIIMPEESEDIDSTCQIFLSIPKGEKDETILKLRTIIGNDNEHLIEDLTFDHEYFRSVTLDMNACSYMLSKIFEIDSPACFDDEVMLVNEDRDIYFYYRD